MTPSLRGRRRVGGAVASVVLLALGLGLLTGRDDLGSEAERLGVQARPQAAAVSDPSFTIGTFNVLGSQHTQARRFAGGTKRVRITAGLIQRKGIDVIGLQEVQLDQLKVLRSALPDYQVWPRRTLGGDGVRLQIAWRRSMFTLVDRGWMDTPFDGLVRPMPWVVLQHQATGRRIYVIDTHNSPRGKESERDAATDQQLALINQLRATKQAVFFLGDMNERREIFCRVVSKTSLQAANGGSAVSKRDCTLPGGPLHIDWIFGAGPVSFTDYRTFDGKQVQQASDHSLVRARVAVRPRR
jgi:endonuclease/exonuclease/phosphatase family metal-dependent hydrolase